MLDHTPYPMTCDDAADLNVRLAYGDTVELLERLHHLFLDVIKNELRSLGVTEITPTQALLVFRVGPRVLTVSDVMQRGCYRGSNVSYNLRKLINGGFLHQRRNTADGRSVLVSLTERGMKVRDVVGGLLEKHAEEMEAGRRLDHQAFETLIGALSSLERFWIGRRVPDR